MQGVTYRVELVVEAEKVEYVADAMAHRRRGTAAETGPVELRHYGDEPLQAGEYTRSELPTGAAVAGRRSSARGCRPRSCAPGRSPRSARSARSSSSRRPD